MSSSLSGSIRGASHSPVLYLVLLALAAMAVAKWARAEPTISCPQAEAGETQQDCPWAGVARVLVAEAEAGRQKQVLGLFKELLPDLDRSLQEDSRRVTWKNLWGRSINYDELASGVIVHPAIIEALSERLGNRAPMILTHFRAEKFQNSPAAQALGKPVVTDPAGHQLVHAGVEHTYGYLFSLLKTPYGYKRARWVQGEIEQGFGLKPGLIGPRPEVGTLFANVTYFAGRIAFRDSEGRTETLRKGAKDLAPQLRDFDFSKLAPVRVEETVLAKDSTGDARKVVLRTDLIPFLHPLADGGAGSPVQLKDTHLLVYSVNDPSNGGEMLITAFPINQSFVELVTKPDNLGEGKPVQTRYNGFVEGITGVHLTGTRKLIELKPGFQTKVEGKE